MSIFQGKQLRSLVTSRGELRVSLVPVETPPPADDEIIVRVEATPLNPSDIGLLFGPADVASFRVEPGAYGAELVADIPESHRSSLARRVDQALVVGNEGCGTVVAAGRECEELLGQRVAMWGGGMYAQYRRLPARDCITLPDGTEAADGAALFINPLTALGFIETARREKHKAIVHTAAASNLGQMLVRLCDENGIGLVNVVRRAEQAELLREQGAAHVVVSSEDDFENRLGEAIAATDATLAFDALGGGALGDTILSAMEAVALARTTTFSRYGSNTHKQLYIYGGLDPNPTVLTRGYGMAWGVAGWLLFDFLQSAGPALESQLRQQVIERMHSTFKSHYRAEIGLDEMLDPEVARAYHRRATGSKYLVRPN